MARSSVGDPLAGFAPPNHEGQSVVNLLSSLIRGRGGRSPHRPLASISTARVSEARHVVYLLVDGLGAAQVDYHVRRGAGGAFFGAREQHSVHAVFPSTTATAVTTFATGTAPAEHAILGWHVLLSELGLIGTILLGTTRTNVPMVPDDFDYHRYFAIPSYLSTVRCRKISLNYGDIARRPFNRALTEWDEVASHRTLRGLSRHIGAVARQRRQSLTYAYWPRYDALCHTHGFRAGPPGHHFSEIDRALARLAEQLRGTGTLLCVTADHGFEEIRRSRVIDLYGIPEFRECLAVAPAGDPRQVACFVRPRRVDQFLRIVRGRLRDVASCISGEELLRRGVLGGGRRHPALARRLADYVLLAREGAAFVWNAPGVARPIKGGSHGGMAFAEMSVPLIAVGP